LQELVDAQRAQHPELSEAGCFAMVYQDPANASLAARERAENRSSAGAAFMSSDGVAKRDVNSDEDGGEAYQKILALAEEAHAAAPEQSVAQHFAKIFSSHEHRELAKAERKENRPVAAAW
jgi:hypothetical protein